MNNAVEEIKDKLPIEDLVSQYVQLKKVGRSLKGLCPFHSEKTPSFIVSPERGIAYCFGCNKGGDIFKFIQEIENVDFVDALKILAERTGIKLEQQSHQPRTSTDQKGRLIELHLAATQLYENELWQTEDGSKVLVYLKNRGLTDESIKLFRLGFAPDSYEKTYSYLLNKGFTKKELVLAGLAMTQETTIEKIYDKFRGRLMFPISDSLGRVVAFGGRSLKKDQDPKYLNSPETPIYHKGNILYGFNLSKPFVKNLDEVVIVEGYMDLIAAFQAGVKNVVATSGTALTVKQLRLLNPFARNLFLAFDMDLAGQEAAKRAHELSQEFDFRIKVVVLPEGKDAADYVKNGNNLVEVVKSAPQYGDYLYDKLLNTYGIASLSAKKRILEEFLPYFQILKSSIEKDLYIRRLAKDLDLKEVQIYDEIKKIKLPSFHPARLHSSLESTVVNSKSRTADEILLGFMLEFPRLAKIYLQNLAEELFSDSLKPIYKALFAHYNLSSADLESKSVIQALDPGLQQTAGLLSLYVVEKYGEIGEQVVEAEIKVLISKLRKNRFENKTKILGQQIGGAEKSGDRVLMESLLKQLGDLHQEFNLK